jgi:hypothetical protein
MSKDPGLYTDSTGEGMAGAEDVALSTQKELGKTLYNGSKACTSCGTIMDPVQSLLNELCANCKRRKHQSLLKGGMA